jgi:hypothetical protein
MVRLTRLNQLSRLQPEQLSWAPAAPFGLLPRISCGFQSHLLIIQNYYQHLQRFNNKIHYNCYRWLPRFFWITSFNKSTFRSRDALSFFRMSFSSSSSLILSRSVIVFFRFWDFRYDWLSNCCIKDYNQLLALHIKRRWNSIYHLPQITWRIHGNLPGISSNCSASTADHP